MELKHKILISCIFLLVLAFIAAAATEDKWSDVNYHLHQLFNISNITISGIFTDGTLTIKGGNITGALYDWVISSASAAYLQFNKTHLSLNETKLNTTIINKVTESNTSLKAYVDSQDALFNDSARDYTIAVNSTLWNLINNSNASMKIYIDAQDVTFNNSARDFTISANTTLWFLLNNSNTSLKAYTDSTFITLASKPYLNVSRSQWSNNSDNCSKLNNQYSGYYWNISTSITQNRNYSYLENFPAACPAGSAVTNLSYPSTCSALWILITSEPYLNVSRAQWSNNSDNCSKLNNQNSGYFLNTTQTPNLNVNSSLYSTNANNCSKLNDQYSGYYLNTSQTLNVNSSLYSTNCLNASQLNDQSGSYYLDNTNCSVDQSCAHILYKTDESNLDVNSSNYWDSLDTQTDITNVGTLVDLDVSGKATFDTTTLVVNHTSHSVGIGTDNISPSAILELNSSTQGFLMPRMTNASMYAISNPLDGLLVWNIDIPSFCFYVGGEWIDIYTGELC